jgi:hypothetical protein
VHEFVEIGRFAEIGVDAEAGDGFAVLRGIGGRHDQHRDVSAKGAFPQFFQQCFPTSAGKIEIEEHDVGTGHLAGIEAFDVLEHFFTVSLHDEFRIQTVVVEGFADENDVTSIVLRQQNANLCSGVPKRLPGLRVR